MKHKLRTKSHVGSESGEGWKKINQATLFSIDAGLTALEPGADAVNCLQRSDNSNTDQQFR
jgi:hypothetical protein